MSPHYTDATVTLYAGDCLDVLRSLPDASVDSVVTDPPYGLEFMGKEWDGPNLWREYVTDADKGYVSDGRTAPKFQTSRPTYAAGLPFQRWCQAWATECLRVLKPGGHMLAFGGTRTSHRLACAVEDAGFEVRDSIAWLYGSGFPKSLDVSKAIDKAAGAQREVVGSKLGQPGYSLAPDLGRSVYNPGLRDPEIECAITAPATPDAERWQGWGTALKPAHEPVVVARKPLAGNVAANVLAHGTGALNVDGCRVDMGAEYDPTKMQRQGAPSVSGFRMADSAPGKETPTYKPGGRWPANVILDESQADALDQMSGELAAGNQPRVRNADVNRAAYGDFAGQHDLEQRRMDQGGASRFFYVAKAATSERPFVYRPTCECEDAWPSTARDIADSARAGGKSSSTSTSGSSTTGGGFPTGTTSTTSTTTSSTTRSTTSDSSPSLSTSGSTPAANSATASGGSPVLSVASSSPSRQSTGTSPAKGGRPTVAAAPATSPAWSQTSVCGNCGAPTRRESHATVKPLDLMRWLVRLVTPPGGLVLEPFAGSGTTVEACILEGFRCIAIERETDYLPLIVQRIHRRRDPVAAVKATGEDGGLFDLLGGTP